MALETRQPDAFAITFVFLGGATVTVALWTILRLKLRQFHLDDILILIAGVISTAQASTAAIWTEITWYGYHSRDVSELSLQDKILSDKVFFAQGLLYNPVLGLVEWSIILFLIRLDDRRRYTRWTLIALQLFNVAHMVSVFWWSCSSARLFTCTGIITKQMSWSRAELSTAAIPALIKRRSRLSTAGISVLTDAAILLVPIAMMWDLHMPTRRKLAVIFVLSLGWVVAVIGIIRIKFFVDFWYGHFRWSLWHTLSSVENNVAIIVACGPAIKAYITRFFPHLLGTSYDRGRMGTCIIHMATTSWPHALNPARQWPNRSTSTAPRHQ